MRNKTGDKLTKQVIIETVKANPYFVSSLLYTFATQGNRSTPRYPNTWCRNNCNKLHTCATTPLHYCI